MDNQKKFVLKDLIIKPNFGNKGWSRDVKDDFPIYIERKYIERKDINYEYLGISLEEAEFIITSLNEIIEHYKNMPEFKIGYHVNIINGKFKGCRGEIIDIDKCDNKRPLAVEVSEVDFSGVCYLNYDDVKL